MKDLRDIQRKKDKVFKGEERKVMEMKEKKHTRSPKNTREGLSCKGKLTDVVTDWLGQISHLSSGEKMRMNEKKANCRKK